MLVFVTDFSLRITGMHVQFWWGNRKEKGQLEDLIVERIILKWALKSIWGECGMPSLEKVASSWEYVNKSFGLQRKRDTSWPTERPTASQRGACYGCLFNFGKQKFHLFHFLALISFPRHTVWTVKSRILHAARRPTWEVSRIILVQPELQAGWRWTTASAWTTSRITFHRSSSGPR